MGRHANKPNSKIVATIKASINASSVWSRNVLHLNHFSANQTAISFNLIAFN